MSCRRVHELLSAYIDGELAPEEACFVEKHLWRCDGCEAELESLRYTKRLLGELARQRPRAELERLLLQEAERLENRAPSSTVWESLRRLGETPIRPRAALATAALSLVTLWAATSHLSGTADEDRPQAGSRVPTGSVALVNSEGTIVGMLVRRPSHAGREAFVSPQLLDSDPLLTTSYRSVSYYRDAPSSSPPVFYSLGRPRPDQPLVLAGFAQ